MSHFGVFKVGDIVINQEKDLILRVVFMSGINTFTAYVLMNKTNVDHYDCIYSRCAFRKLTTEEMKMIEIDKKEKDKTMQTIAEFIKDLPVGTKLGCDNKHESWRVAETLDGEKWLMHPGRYSLGVDQCSVFSIPGLRVIEEKRKVLKGRIVFKNIIGTFDVTRKPLTRKEFEKLCPEFTFIRFLTESPEFPVEEVEE